MEDREQDEFGSGGTVEFLILFAAGCIMAGIASGLLYFVYRMSTDGQRWNYEELYMTGCIGLAFFLLRGALYTIFSENSEEDIKMSHDR